MKNLIVTCHMYTSLDGKIETSLKGFPDNDVGGEFYDAYTFSHCDGWGCGRDTFTYLVDETESLDNYEEYKGELADHFTKDKMYCFAFCNRGVLLIKDIYNDYYDKKSRFVMVLKGQVDRRYITYLNEKGISYLICGDESIDLKVFLEKIEKLGLKRFLICGGPRINASFFNEDLVDEISLVMIPSIQGGRKELTFVGTDDVSSYPKDFAFKDVKVLEDGTLHLLYVRK